MSGRVVAPEAPASGARAGAADGARTQGPNPTPIYWGLTPQQIVSLLKDEEIARLWIRANFDKILESFHRMDGRYRFLVDFIRTRQGKIMGIVYVQALDGFYYRVFAISPNGNYPVPVPQPCDYEFIGFYVELPP